MENVKAIKLVSGEDIICKYQENDSGDVEITEPLQLVPVPTRNGDPNFYFVPFPLYSKDKTYKIQKDKILFVCNVGDEFLTQYNSVFSGIISPPKSLIV